MPNFVQEAENLIASAKVVVVQLEIAVESSFTALRLAKKHSVKSIFNVAPGIKDLPREMLAITDILCLNETEVIYYHVLPNLLILIIKSHKITNSIQNGEDKHVL